MNQPTLRLSASLVLTASLAAAPAARAADLGTRPRPEVPPLEFGAADAAVLAFDAASSCLISGIGAATKKKKAHAGCLKGALVAAPLIYAGQKGGSYAGNAPGTGYPATLVHSLGVSVRDNVADGDPMLARYQTAWGPVQVSVGAKEHNDGAVVQGYFMPVPALGMLYGFADGRLDLKKTLASGAPTFKAKLALPEKLNRESIGGVTLPNVILEKGDMTYGYGHEFLHVLQHRELSFFDLGFDNKGAGKWLKDRHVKVGQDFGMLVLQPPGAVLPHDARPVELVPLALELEAP